MTKHLQLLLAEEDKKDCLFFTKALSEIPIPVKVKTVNNGEELMKYLLENSDKLPDILFLDFNMPCKNGAECLAEIKQHKKLKSIPVIVYSETLHMDIADLLYDQGAHFYIRKMEFTELKLTLHRLLNMLAKTDFKRPGRKKFIFNLVEAD
jgi:response regulator RpfG family c-di-GMP phosphodiesterase